MMTRRRVMAYVDGFNFYYRRLRNKPYRWLNLVAMFENLLPDDDIVEVKYFTTQVTGKFDSQKPLRQQAYLRALGTIPRLTVVMGQFITTPVRYRLVDPITDLSGKVIEAASVKFAVEQQKTVLIIHPDSNPAQSLVRSATGSLHLHDSHLRDAQLAPEITLANGKKIRKPHEFS